MKNVTFHFNDGSYKTICGYGSTESECIADAKMTLNEYEVSEISNTTTY